MKVISTVIEKDSEQAKSITPRALAAWVATIPDAKKVELIAENEEIRLNMFVDEE